MDNPYASPQCPPFSPEVVLDREARDQLRVLVRSFLDEECSAFEFDEALQEFSGSADSAVRFVAEMAWYHYDDYEDHYAALSRREWGLFQRLLLLLESDCQVESEQKWLWSWTQAVALGLLAIFVAMLCRVPWDDALLIYGMPLGLASVLLGKLRRSGVVATPFEQVLYPFASFADLRDAYDAVSFRKARYPRHLSQRRIRSPLGALGMQLHYLTFLLMFGPLVLALQTLPRSMSHAHVAPPAR